MRSDRVTLSIACELARLFPFRKYLGIIIMSRRISAALPLTLVVCWNDTVSLSTMSDLRFDNQTFVVTGAGGGSVVLDAMNRPNLTGTGWARLMLCSSDPAAPMSLLMTSGDPSRAKAALPRSASGSPSTGRGMLILLGRRPTWSWMKYEQQEEKQ